MADSKKPSIFDEASKSLSKKRLAPNNPLKKTHESVDVKAKVTPSETSAFEEQKLPKNDENQEIINRIRRMSEELEAKLDNVYKETGLSENQLQEYLSDPRHFTPGTWEKIELVKKRFGIKMWDALGLSYKKRKIQLEEKNTKERKAKTLGERRKWIPIH